MGEQFLAGLAPGAVFSFAKEDVGASGECFGVEGAVELVGMVVGVDADTAEVGAHDVFHVSFGLVWQLLPLAPFAFDVLLDVAAHGRAAYRVIAGALHRGRVLSLLSHRLLDEVFGELVAVLPVDLVERGRAGGVGVLQGTAEQAHRVSRFGADALFFFDLFLVWFWLWFVLLVVLLFVRLFFAHDIFLVNSFFCFTILWYLFSGGSLIEQLHHPGIAHWP